MTGQRDGMNGGRDDESGGRDDLTAGRDMAARRTPSRRPRFLTVERGGEYLRVADPEWDDPLSGAYARERGGRWNPAGSFPVVYLNGDDRVARANVLRRFEGLPYGPDDLDPSTGPVLVATEVPLDAYVDVVSRAGRAAAGLPATYPRDAAGEIVGHAACRPVGTAAWQAGYPGIACRSAAPAAPADGEELAWFDRGTPLRVARTMAFGDWY